MVAFVMLYKGLLTFKQVNKSLLSDHSNESYQEILPMQFSLSFNNLQKCYFQFLDLDTLGCETVH